MHFYTYENDYDSDIEQNEYRELTNDIAYEERYDKKMLIINHYRDLLYYEPEFIGIKNISCHKILRIMSEKIDFISLDFNLLNNNFIEKCKKNNIKIFTYTCKSMNDFNYIDKFDIDGIVSDIFL